MYLAAQRVRSAARTGINVFLYRHSHRGIPWRDPVHVVEHMPGKLVSSAIDVPPGGNAVLSFLDVVAEGDLGGEELLEQVERLRAHVIRDGVAAADGVGVRFTMTGEPARPEREWSELVGRAFSLLARPLPLKWQSGEAVVIRREVDGTGQVFALTPSSTSKLRETLGPRWSPPQVFVSHPTLGDLSRVGYELYEQLGPAMTGYRLEELLSFGRVRVEDASGAALWEWPAADHGLGYCLTCRRQHTLAVAAGGFRCTNCGTEQANDGRFVAALT